METAPSVVDTFLRTVLRSGLLRREELQESLRSLPRDQRTDPGAMAEHLVKLGKLSRFQAGKLLEGAPLGLVLGSFQVLAPIGKGGMGTVYLARDIRSDMLLALKVLPPKRAREEDRILARFRREMEMSQRVAHPHIAWTYEVGVHQGVYYIAMEYIPGKSLHRLIQDEGPLSVPRAARLFAELASALDHAHHQGLIHRDLKPSNILITPHDHAKLLDLGLALMTNETERDRKVIGGEGYVVGTMDYIAPEQAENPAKVDGRCDIYSLGCTLYYSLTGQPPFPGGSARERMQRHQLEEAQPISRFNPAVPARFAELAEKMMAKDPDDRFFSASAVEEALRDWAGADAKPLDQRTDREYEHAIHQLETQEPPRELLQEVIPMGILVSDSGPMSPLPFPRRPSDPAVPIPSVDSAPNLLRIRALIVGGFVLGVLGVVFLVLLWLFR